MWFGIGWVVLVIVVFAVVGGCVSVCARARVFVCVYVFVCVRACVRARVRACVCVCVWRGVGITDLDPFILVSNLAFYAQSTSTVISGRFQGLKQCAIHCLCLFHDSNYKQDCC